MAKMFSKNGRNAKKLGKIAGLALHALGLCGNDPCQRVSFGLRRDRDRGHRGGRRKGGRADVRIDSVGTDSTQRDLIPHQPGEVCSTMAKKAAPKAANGKAPSPTPGAASKPADAPAPAPAPAPSPAAARPKWATKA